VSDSNLAEAPPTPADDRRTDPIRGAGVAILGVVLMGTGGAVDSHLLFDIGIVVAIAGGLAFGALITLTARRLRKAERAAPTST
jgi:drug/metabolite transporter (DMT)-like permease